MKTIKYSTMISSSLSKIVKTRAIFMLFGMMGLTFLAQAQAPYSGWVMDGRTMNEKMDRLDAAMSGIMSNPRDYTDRLYTDPMANRPLGRPGPTYYPKFNTPSYPAPNYIPQRPTHQRQSGRTLQWKTGAGQQLRLDRLYVGLDANLILKAFGRPDKVSWQYSTWTYQNLNIQNPLTGRQYRNVTFVVKNRKIQYASVH